VHLFCLWVCRGFSLWKRTWDRNRINVSKECRIQFAGVSVPSQSSMSELQAVMSNLYSNMRQVCFIRYIIRGNVSLLSFPCVGFVFQQKSLHILFNILPLASSRLCATARACVQTHMCTHISLTECNSGVIQKLSFGVNTTIELKNLRPTIPAHLLV
jgi:hypothetical protein